LPGPLTKFVRAHNKQLLFKPEKSYGNGNDKLHTNALLNHNQYVCHYLTNSYRLLLKKTDHSFCYKSITKFVRAHNKQLLFVSEKSHGNYAAYRRNRVETKMAAIK